MLFLLVAVMREDRGEFLVLAGVDALVVPVDGLQFLHQRYDGPVHVPGLVGNLTNRLVIALV